MTISTIDLASFTSGNKGFIIQGAMASDYLGQSVSSAGDVNGDGYDDIIIGAPDFSATWNQPRTAAGTAYVIFGKASGFNTIDLASFTSGSSGFIIQGAVVGDGTGISVSGAGDVNGDGYDDIIVGSDYADPKGRSDAGTAHVIFGKASGFSTIDLASFTSGSGGFIIQGAAAGDQLGKSVSGAGDVNNDGYADVIVGAPYADPNSRSSAGAAYVIFGKASGFNTIDLASFASGFSGFIIQGAKASDFAGSSVSGAGDVNGDSYDDIIVGSSWADPNGRSDAGTAHVIFGKANGIDTTGGIATSVFRTIDLASFTSGSSGFIIQGAEADDLTGDSVSKAGDVNGDSYDDIIIGSRWANPKGRSDAGTAHVIFGKADDFRTIDLASFTSGSSGFIIQGAKASDLTGTSVNSAGDINIDGYDDIIIGAVRAGTAHVIFGKADDFRTIDLASFTSGSSGFIIKGAVAGDSTGASVSSAGDINGDGYDEIIIGSYSDPEGRSDAGAAYIIFGSTTIVTGTIYNDTFIATSIPERFVGNGGVDTVSYENSLSGVNVDFATGLGKNGHANNDTYLQITNIIGSSYADTLIGNNLVNNISGGEGNDLIEGRGSADVLNGGAGINTVSYKSSPGRVIVNLDLGNGLEGEAQGDTLINFNNIIGSDFDDILIGNAESNIITAGNGNDIIQGEGGDDILWGGSGIDTFKITSSNGGTQIRDFDSSIGEKLDFSFFKSIRSIEDISFQNIGEDTQIYFANNQGRLILRNVKSNQLTENNFIFAEQDELKESWFDKAANKLIFAGSIVGSVATILGAAYGGYCFFNKEKPFCKEPGKVIWHGAKVMFSPFSKAASCLAGASEEGSAKHHSTPNLDNVAKSAATAVAITTTATAKASFVEDFQYNLEKFGDSFDMDFSGFENSTLTHGGNYDF